MNPLYTAARNTRLAASFHGPAVSAAAVVSLAEARAGDRATLVRYDDRGSRAALRLFCFPWSGASASAFRSWAAAMPEEIELVGVQLPGRGGRREESASARLAPVARQVARVLRMELEESPGPFAFFGHSLGALLAHEVACRLEARGHRPQLVVLSGSRAPHRPPRVCLHRLEDADLLGVLEGFGGMSARGGDPEFLARFLPLVRADLTAVETHQPADPGLLCGPVSGWAGAEDWYAPPEEVQRWGCLAGSAWRSRVFSGGHFFTGDLARARAALLDDLAWSRQQVGGYRVRPMVAADREAMLAMVGRCGGASLYERFQTYAAAAPRRHVETLFADPDCYTAVVEGPPGAGGQAGQIVGFGSLFFDRRGAAEVALLVADEHQGRGVGARLAEHLRAHAASQGVDRLEVTTRATPVSCACSAAWPPRSA
jgi:surfactin synthase thioesterase subunit/GNAT superfamily N-acetyltransferase